MIKVIVILVVTLLVFSSVALAACGSFASGHKAKGEIVNDTCPVMGGKVDKDTPYATVYKGKKIGFCCSGCVGKFNENPKAYMKKLQKECVIECPKCGAKIDVKKECGKIGKACPITQRGE